MSATASMRFIGLALSDAATALEAAASSGLSADWFGTDSARDTWKAILALESENRPIDIHFVAAYAESHGISIPEEYLSECVRVAPGHRNSADELVSTIRAEYIRRECKSVAAMLEYEDGDPVELASAGAEQLMRLSDMRGRLEKSEIKATIEKEWDDAAKGILGGVPCPLRRLYEQSGGPPVGAVTVIVAHGGTGKSALSLQWSDFAANNGWPCVYFPFEDTEIGAYRRLAGMKSGISIFKLAMGKGDDQEISCAKLGLDSAMASPLIIDGEIGTIHDIGARVQRYVAKHGVRAIFVDAIKDVISTKEGVERDNEIIEGLDRIAKRHRIAVVATHHVRKAPNTATDYAAWNIDRDSLKGSGKIWDTARQVIALQMYPKTRGKKYPEITKNSVFQYYWQVLKNNNGIAHIRHELHRTNTLEWVEISDIEDAVKYTYE